LAFGGWAFGGWRLGFWRLAVGFWLLAFGGWEWGEGELRSVRSVFGENILPTEDFVLLLHRRQYPAHRH